MARQSGSLARRSAAFVAFVALPVLARAAPAQHAPSAQHAIQAQHAARATPVVTVRAQIVSGTPQAAHAYVAPAAPKYVTEFTQPLVVRVVGTRNAKPAVRFTCVSTGCELPPQEQPDAVKRIDPRTFEVAVENGTASIKLIVSTAAPQTVDVVAEPVVRAGERAVRSAPFALTAQ